MPTLHEIRTHPEYVEGCFGCKAGSLRVGYCGRGGQDYTAQKKWDAELESYRRAKSDGIRPEGTTTRRIRQAVEWSNRTGVAYSQEAKYEYDTDRALERYAA